jgi:hypothetical protein
MSQDSKCFGSILKNRVNPVKGFGLSEALVLAVQGFGF